MPWYLIVLLFLAVASGSARAQEVEAKEQLVLPNFESKLFTPLANEQLRSVLLRVSAKQQMYHLLLQDGELSSKAENLRSIDLDYKRIGRDRLRIEASIIDLKSGKKIKRVFKNEFHKRELLRTSELALEVLFNLKPNRELISPKKPKAVVKAKAKSPTPPKNENLIAFRERIVSIKGDIKKEFGALAEKKKQKEGSDDGESANPRKKQNKSASGSGLFNKMKKEDDESEGFDPTKVWSFSYGGYFGFDSQNFETTDQKGTVAEVQIRTNLVYAVLGGDVALRSKKMPQLLMKGRAEYLIPVLEDDQVEGESALNFGLGLAYLFQKLPARLGIGFEKESLMFGSLPQVGEGLELAVYELYWTSVQGQLDLGKNWNVFIGGSFLVSAQSGNEFSNPEDFEAAKFEAGARFDSSWLWDNSRFLGTVSTLDFVNQYGFGTEGSRFTGGIFMEKSF